MEFDKPQRKSPYQKKQEDYDRERIRLHKYPHRHRRDYPRVKKRFKRMERHMGQSLINLALLEGSADEVSDALLKTISVRLKGPKHRAASLRDVVEHKLEKRVRTHGARKRRHGLPYTPRSLPKAIS